MPLGAQPPGPHPYRLLESSVPSGISLPKLSRSLWLKFWDMEILKVRGWLILHICPAPTGGNTFLKGQDPLSVTLRNESVNGSIASVWIKLEEMHIISLKWQRIIHSSPQFLVNQTTLRSPTAASHPGFLWSGAGLWSEPGFMWGGYLCCLYYKITVKNYINYFYHMWFGIISFNKFCFSNPHGHS